MEPNDVLTIPVDAYAFTTLRSYASDLSYSLRRKYSTRRNREARTFTITRIY